MLAAIASMKGILAMTRFKSALAGFAIGLATAAAAAQAAQHEHQGPQPTASTPAPHAPPAKPMDMKMMMNDPAHRQAMMEQMGKCRDMMSMMMEHMQHGAKKSMQPPASPKQ